MSIDLKIDDLNTIRTLRKVFREIGRELNVIEDQAKFEIPPRMTKTDLVQEKIRRFTEIENAVRRAGLTMGDVVDGLVEIEIGLEERDRLTRCDGICARCEGAGTIPDWSSGQLPCPACKPMEGSEATTAGAIRQSVGGEAIADVTQIRELVRERNDLVRQLAEAQAHNVQLRAAIEDLANRAERARRILQESGRRDGLRPDHCNWGMLDTSAARAALTEDTTNTSTQYVRSELAWFADRMERKLRTNDHKDHWRGMSVVQLLLGLFDEYLELQEAVNLGEPDKIIDEAIDCGAFAMMIADRVALEATPSNRTSTDGQNTNCVFAPDP